MKASFIRSIVQAGLIFAACGCASTVGLSPQKSRSGFDDARTVSIVPHGNATGGLLGDGNATGIGAEWSEAHPDTVVLKIAVYNVIIAIDGAELNIDGEKIKLTPTANSTSFDQSIVKTSVKGFVAPLEIVEKIIYSKRTWLRVHTTEGSVENAVIDGEKDSKAFHALKRFYTSVRLN